MKAAAIFAATFLVAAFLAACSSILAYAFFGYECWVPAEPHSGRFFLIVASHIAAIMCTPPLFLIAVEVAREA